LVRLWENLNKKLYRIILLRSNVTLSKVTNTSWFVILLAKPFQSTDKALFFSLPLVLRHLYVTSYWSNLIFMTGTRISITFKFSLDRLWNCLFRFFFWFDQNWICSADIFYTRFRVKEENGKLMTNFLFLRPCCLWFILFVKV